MKKPAAKDAVAVLKLFGIAEQAEVRPLGWGEINATYFVKSEAKKFILQRLSSIFNPKVIEDFDAVTRHLEKAGWEVPRIVPAKDGKLYCGDRQDGIWRLMTYIDSDTDTPRVQDNDLPYHAYGELLGKLHASLEKLDYLPQFKIPHFHDTTYYAGRLSEIQDRLPLADKPLADRILSVYRSIAALPDWPDQLLHGDPRTSNMLFRGGRPFTYIDFDTIMFGQVWVDLGDLLRSLAEDQQVKEGQVNVAKLLEVVEGYRAAVHPDMDSERFQAWGLTAARKIALELAMRYMIDIVEDYYFTWDAAKFGGRRDSHLSRTQEQLTIFDSLQ